MSKSTRAPVIAFTAFACLAGCHLVKVNGKPLGGSSSAPSSASATNDAPSPNASPKTAAATDTASTNAAATSSGAQANAALCKDVGLSNARGDVSAADFADVSMKEDDASSVASQFAHMMCTRGTVRERDAIMAIRARWMKTHGFDERDVIVLAAESRRLTYESQDEHKMPGPLSQLTTTGRRSAADGLVELDQLGARASMFSRFSVVKDCLTPTAEHNPLLRHILCTREPLDAAKAYAEIDSVDELNNGTRYRLRRMIKKTADAVARARAELAARAKDDPGIAKVIAIADAQFEEWARLPAARAQLVAQLEAMEAATRGNKRSAFAGCDATTRAAWQKHIKTVDLPKVPSEKALGTILTSVLETTEGYLAFEALRLCAWGTSSARADGSTLVGSVSLRRGPRTATIAAWFSASSTIKFDAKDLQIGHLLVNGKLPLTTASHDVPRQLQGVIAGIEHGEDTTKITFKTVVEPREDCLKWHETNRIDSWRHDGSPVYRRECVKWGMIKMDLTAAPITVPKLMAHGLAPGMYLVGVEGLAIAATTAAKSSTPIWVLGAPVK